jgi:hypothetical protein
MLKYQHEVDNRAKEEIAAEVARIRDTEIAAVKREEAARWLFESGSRKWLGGDVWCAQISCRARTHTCTVGKLVQGGAARAQETRRRNCG